MEINTAFLNLEEGIKSAGISNVVDVVNRPGDTVENPFIEVITNTDFDDEVELLHVANQAGLIMEDYYQDIEIDTYKAVEIPNQMCNIYFFKLL